MDRIDHPDAFKDKFGPGKHGFTEGTPNLDDATVVTGNWADGVQEELMTVIEAAGIVPSSAVFNQLLTALQTLIGVNVPNASSVTAGVTRYADAAETIAGILASVAVTPAGLAALTATNTRRGLIQLATIAQVLAGTDTDKAVTSAGLAALTGDATRRGLLQLATIAQVLAGVDTSRAVTSAGLASVALPLARRAIPHTQNNVTVPAHNYDVLPVECFTDEGWPIVLSALLTKQTNAAWAPGNNAGGWADGAAKVALGDANLFLIGKAGDPSAVDSFAGPLPTSPIPAAAAALGFNTKLRIGTIPLLTGAALALYGQDGIEFTLRTMAADIVNATVGNVSALLLTLTIPAVPRIVAKVRARGFSATNGAGFILFDNEETDQAVTGGNPDFAGSTGGDSGVARLDVRSNGARQIKARASFASSTITVSTRGWFDPALKRF